MASTGGTQTLRGITLAGKGAASRSVLAGAALLALSLLAGCMDVPGAVAVGERAPAFAGRDLNGSTVDLRALRGEVVLVNVWATWCFPCRREMPALEQLHRDLAGSGLRVVAVSIDAAGAERDVREFVAEYGLTFDIVHDPAQEVTRAFRTIGVPETFLVDAEGRLRRHWIGRIDPHSESVRGPIRDVMQEAGALAARRR
jgi:cytochrome c biogenesis protein CcmG, thiol:disulfide interchange protein DsbE